MSLRGPRFGMGVTCKQQGANEDRTRAYQQRLKLFSALAGTMPREEIAERLGVRVVTLEKYEQETGLHLQRTGPPVVVAQKTLSVADKWLRKAWGTT